MSNYVRMYAVPKEKYDAFLSGACKGDVGPYVMPNKRAGTDRGRLQIEVALLSVPAGNVRNDLERPLIEVTRFSGLFFASLSV